MPPARFGASKFRNAVPFVIGREDWYRGNLPSASTSTTTSSSISTFSSEVKANRKWIVTVSPSGDVSWREYGRGESAVGTMKVGPVGDWDLSVLEDGILVIGGTDGNVRVYEMPTDGAGGLGAGVLSEKQTISVGSSITNTCLHSATPSLLLVSGVQAPLAIYDLSTSSASPTITLELDEPKGLWTIGWSHDGSKVAAVGRSGKGYVFDPRNSTSPSVSKTLSIQPLKPVRLVWVEDKIFLTGWDRSRNRLYSLLSSTDLSSIFSQNIDTNLSPLTTVVDHERSIIYLAGRGDMSIRQVELGGVTGFQETVHSLPYPLSSTSLAAAHPTHLDVMQAEIGRILVPVVDKDGDTILPLGIKVPRRQLIDFHEDLYPDITGTISEQTAQDWLAGGDAKPFPFTLDPGRRSTWESRLSTRPTANTAKSTAKESDKLEPEPDASLKQPDASEPVSRQTTPVAPKEDPVVPTNDVDKADETAKPEPENSLAGKTASASRNGSAILDVEEKSTMPAVSPIVASTPAPAESAKVGAAPEISRASRPAAKAPDTAPTGERYNPTWSRKFLAGKSPLIPTYDSVPPLSSLHQDSVIFKITPHLAFFPVQGPGGRLGVHPLKKKGRMPNGGHGYLSGGVEIADFDVEPFGQRVAIAGEDGLIRLWSVGEDGVQGVGAEAEQVLKGDGIDKIATIAFHPTAKDLLTALTNEQGSCAVRFFDLAQGQEVKRCPLDLDGAFNMAWSPQGDKVAIATKDGRLMVLDPRRQDSQAVGKAHDSPRSFQITWIDDTHLLSVGFSRGSQRRINLYSIDQGSSGQIETTSSFLMDISPSVLFPHYDPDTSILYVWGKGERQIQAFEIRPEDKNEPIAKLPSFTSGSPQLGVSFFPKRMVDIKKVEVARVLRLTAKSIEEVGFSIPRNKPDFFQDDIYVDTLDTEHDSTTAQEWLGGARSDVQYLSLKLDGMTLLSQAPKTDTTAKKKFVPAANVMSEEERKRKEMNDLFQRAKMDESSEEDEPKQSGLAPPDDDW